MGAVQAIQTMSHWVPPVPVILESVVSEGAIQKELDLARLCFDVEAQAARSAEATRPVPAKAV
jgi:hypothetical protein